MDIENMTHRDKTRYVQKEVKKVSDEVKAKYPILQNQDAIGMGIMLSCLAVIALTGYSYHVGAIPAWVCVVIVGVATSLMHELEHDLIHYMYFKNNKLLHNVMMLMVWIVRPGTINPWVRRVLHLRHHKVSGTVKDTEETFITNGMPWGIKRFFMMIDPFAALTWDRHGATLKQHISKIIGALFAYFPMGFFFFAAWYSFLLFHGVNFFGGLVGFTPEWSAGFLSWIENTESFVVILGIPHFIRSASINFVSSNMHYFGDIEDGNVVEQTQVLTAWWLAPFHLFCFNFGATHAIHHFVVRDPFYIRQLTAKQAYVFMREVGVRFNDYGTFSRANRFNMSPA